MDLHVMYWVGFAVVVLAALALDLGVFNRKPHAIGVKEALGWSAVWIALALCFNAVVWLGLGENAGKEFLTGYLIEKSLSVDNIFVFVLIFKSFAIPPQYQHRVLFWGIFGAIMLRAIMIGVGSALVQEVHWILYVFGGFLLITGIKMLFATDDEEEDPAKNPLVRFFTTRIPMTDKIHGPDFFTYENGKRLATPLFICLISIEIADVIFAVDSIPAIFAITTDPFIVFSSNIFAILGLRSLYFALAAIVPRFIYLKYGLSLVLVVIGVKMIANTWTGDKVIPTEWALALTAVLVVGSILISLWATRGQKADEPEA